MKLLSWLKGFKKIEYNKEILRDEPLKDIPVPYDAYVKLSSNLQKNEIKPESINIDYKISKMQYSDDCYKYIKEKDKAIDIITQVSSTSIGSTLECMTLNVSHLDICIDDYVWKFDFIINFKAHCFSNYLDNSIINIILEYLESVMVLLHIDVMVKHDIQFNYINEYDIIEKVAYHGKRAVYGDAEAFSSLGIGTFTDVSFVNENNTNLVEIESIKELLGVKTVAYDITGNMIIPSMLNYYKRIDIDSNLLYIWDGYKYMELDEDTSNAVYKRIVEENGRINKQTSLEEAKNMTISDIIKN